MDALAGFLDGPRARGAFLLRSVLDPPWSLRIEDESRLTVVAVVRGSSWIVPDGEAPVADEAKLRHAVGRFNLTVLHSVAPPSG